MSRTAKQIVNKLLEYGIDPDMVPAGHPDDPWRQSKGPLPPMTFGGRPGPLDEPEDEEEEIPPAPAASVPPVPKPTPPSSAGPMMHPRFQWRPPPATESNARRLLKRMTK